MYKKIILKIVIIFIFIVLIVPIISNATTEEISSYKSEIYIQEDLSMIVEETIEVYAGGINIKKGIYRDFPTNYKDKNGNDYKVGFEVLEVLKDGEEEPYKTENQQNGVRVYIGDSNKTLKSGYYTYTIKYKTDKQIGHFDDHDELYWNVTGNGWSFAIDNATAIVHLLDNVDMNKVNFEAYTGEQGSKEKEYTAYKNEYDNTVTFSTTKKLYKNEGLTIVVEFQNGKLDKDAEKPKDSIEEDTLSKGLPADVNDNAEEKNSYKKQIIVLSIIEIVIIVFLILVYIKFKRRK